MYKKRFIKFGILVLSPIVLFLAFLFILNNVKADDRTWIQTDWRGGVLENIVTNDEGVNTFLEGEGINYSQEGKFSLFQPDNWHLEDRLYRNIVDFSDLIEEEEFEELTDITVPVKLESGVNIDYSHFQPEGEDIRFLSSLGEELSYEIGFWDNEGESFIWVLLPTLNPEDDRYFYMYYGNDAVESPSYEEEIEKLSPCTGGEISLWEDYYIHAFTSEEDEFICSVDLDADVLVVAGGGGGGSSLSHNTYRGGGGGAGGLVFRPNYDISSESVMNIVVGDGGGVGSHQDGEDGGNSVFDNLIALGGGGGGGPHPNPGKDGGSGGGGSGSADGGSGLQPFEFGESGEFGFGNAGGDSTEKSTSGSPVTGGGGGAGERGYDGPTEGGHGGEGLNEVEIDGITYNFANLFGNSFGELIYDEIWFAGGGGGGNMGNSAGEGGSGGGGDGSTNNDDSTSGDTNTGGGGGGGTANRIGGDGGSGIVLVRVHLSSGTFFSLGELERKHPDSGYLESNIFDAGYPSDWGIVEFDSSYDNYIDLRVRSSDSFELSSFPSWSECTPLSFGDDVKLGSCVEDTHRYIQYRVDISLPSNLLSPEFEEIRISFTASDQTPPEVNAHDIRHERSSFENGDWLKSPPLILWEEGVDDPEGDGVEGYCISLEEVEVNGESSFLDPQFDSGVLMGLDDGVTNDACPYIVVGEELDFNTIEGLTLSNNKEYYFSIKAVDYAGNVWEGEPSDYSNLFWFKYDKINPSNVTYISTPSSTHTFGSVNDMFFSWPLTGGSKSVDHESGILGWQYAINSTDSWYGTDYDEKLDIYYLPLVDSEGYFQFSDQEHGEHFFVGNNTIYFRSLDNSGRHSSFVTAGLNYGGAAPSFPDNSSVTVSPSVSTSNEFSLSWPEAIFQEGQELYSYYYMINIQPPSDVNTLKSNRNIYIPIESRNLSSRLLQGAVRGSNQVYVVAVDSSENYSPTYAISGTFTLNSTFPDPPRNVSISDTSIKSAELWRVALAWDEPSYQGNGALTYFVEKSKDGKSWQHLGSLNGTAFSDICESSRLYYYRVGVTDSSQESLDNPSYSAVFEITPTGRYEEAPSLVSEPTVSSITARRATINWVTDRLADSKLYYGLDSNDYFESYAGRLEKTLEHALEVTNLRPDTIYYYRSAWTDSDGNTGTSREYTFMTKPAPRVENAEITSVGLDYAMLNMTLRGATHMQVLYGTTPSYGGILELNTSVQESEYSVILPDLEDGTQYHYTILLTDEDGYVYDGFGDHLFTTPPRPRVSNIQLQEKLNVPTSTVEVFWSSNIPVSSIVTYYPLGNPDQVLDKIDMELKREHHVEISNLDSSTVYQLSVSGVDRMGNRTDSDLYTFTTAVDTRPPEIFNIRSVGDIQGRDVQPDRNRSAQLVISWETDEPATSQVLYGEGTSLGHYPFSTQTDLEYRMKHVVIVSHLSPSTVYNFKIVSRDLAGNVGESSGITAITPKGSDTVIESVLGSLSNIFRFLR